MRKPRLLLIVLPSMLVVGLLLATLTTSAQAKGPRLRDRWEYRYYFCADNDACAQDHAKGAYEELDKLGEDGWEAYAYSSKAGSGFDWELRRAE